MKTIKITFENNDTITTSIIGTENEIKNYYKIGSLMNIGTTEDNLQKITSIEFIE